MPILHGKAVDKESELYSRKQTTSSDIVRETDKENRLVEK